MDTADVIPKVSEVLPPVEGAGVVVGVVGLPGEGEVVVVELEVTSVSSSKNSISCCSNAAVSFKLASALANASIAAVATVSGKPASRLSRKSLSWKEGNLILNYSNVMMNKPFALAPLE